MSVLLTRPLEDSLAMQAELKAAGIESLIAPMLRIEPEAVVLDGITADAIIATSRHAFEAVQAPETLQHTPLYVVGQRTAEAAAAKGWQGDVHVSDNSAQLIEQLEKQPPQSLLYLRGEEITANLAAALPQHDWQEMVTYRAVATSALSDDIRRALESGEISAVVFASKRSAALFEQAAQEMTLPPLTALCLSQAIADSLTLPCWQSRLAAQAPTGEALIALIQSIHNRAA